MSVTNLEDKIEKSYKSEAMAAIHETMESLYKLGTIDKKTMHKFDETCLGCQTPEIPVKNIELLITHMIKQHYEWEEIVAVIRMIKKGKGEDLIKIIKDTIN